MIKVELGSSYNPYCGANAILTQHQGGFSFELILFTPQVCYNTQ